MIGQITDLGEYSNAISYAPKCVMILTWRTAIQTQGWRYFLLFVICNVTNAMFFWAFLPETKGVPLEEMKALFQQTGWFVPGQNYKPTTTQLVELQHEIEEKQNTGMTHVESV